MDDAQVAELRETLIDWLRDFVGHDEPGDKPCLCCPGLIDAMFEDHLAALLADRAALTARLKEVEGEVERLRAEAADTIGGRRVARLHESYGDQIKAAFDAEAAAEQRAEQAEGAVARVEALAESNDLWRATPCGCGHRADLHDAGDTGRKPMCSGGLGLCGCDWSFWRVAQARLRAALRAEDGGQG